MAKSIKTAVAGCGAISDIYLTNMIGKYETLEVVACCAKHRESAERQGKKYGIRPCTFEEILADEEIRLLVVLTPAPTHFELIWQALKAGKHVFTEKTLTTSLEDAQKLLKLSDEKGLYLGAAPDTFLGSGIQTAYRAIQDGLLGEITSFHITANRDIDVLASIFQFLRMPGGGICFDYGVYYLTALISLLGPVSQVFSVVKNRCRERVNVFPESPDFGKPYIYDNESQVDAVITMKSGVTGTFALNGDSVMVDLAEFTIHGTKGILRLGDANQFGAEISLIPNDAKAFKDGLKPEILTPVSSLSENCRGIGPAEMAYAILNNKKQRASKEMAYHVLDTIVQIMESGKTQMPREVTSSCTQPEYFDEWQELIKINL